jgi:tetratricopeptide (TPR) repeat protein
MTPEWYKSNPIAKVEVRENGMEQWQYAIDTWGSKGSRQWKKEIIAFEAVQYYFPNDKEAAAKAKLGIASVYYRYLSDYRRAIVEADELIALYPDQEEQVASALCNKGWAYYMLEDYEKSRESFDRIISDYSHCENCYESALEGIERLDSLQD